MSAPNQATPTLQDIVKPLIDHPKRWIVPAVIITLLASGYVLVRKPIWQASQALIVRNEATNNEVGPGKFSHTDQMKTVQETILELAKSRNVLKAVLEEVGAPADYAKDATAWPTVEDVADLREALKILPPKGAEFGKTEVFYLKVKSDDRRRAVLLTTTLVERLKSRFQQLLDDRAASVINELDKAVVMAETNLKESTAELAKLEQSVGSDLAELRILHESPAGSSDLRRKLVEVENELRKAETDRRARAELLSLLQMGSTDPDRLVSLPGRLLESHAMLRQLSTGLSAARLNTCNLLGKMSREHPTVQSAEAEHAEIRRSLQSELNNAIEIAKVELRLADTEVTSLKTRLDDMHTRFNKLAGLRAPYTNLVAETNNRTDTLESAQRDLADARASRAAAKSASLIARIDLPDTGVRPLGPSRTIVVLAGLAGGLFAGWGIVLLTVRTPVPSGQSSFPACPAPAEAPGRTAASNGNGKVRLAEPSVHSAGGLSFDRTPSKA